MAEESGASILTFGPGQGNPAIGIAVADPDPLRDYIYTGPGRLTPQIPQLLQQEIDDVTRSFGFKVYEAMLTDPAVYSSYLQLKLSIISGPVRVRPAYRPRGYREGAATPVDSAVRSKMSPAEKRAVEIAEFCNRDRRRMDKSLKMVLVQLLDMLAFGHKLAEKTRSEVAAGPDAGKLGLARVDVKPSWAWKFVVNATMKPVGILTYVPPDIFGKYAATGADPQANGGLFIVPISKFVLATWLPRDNDPRGTSALRAAYDWWNLKRQAMPFYYQHLRRFGSPSLDGEIAEGDTQDRLPIDPTTGLEIKGQAKVSPIQRMTQALIAFQNNSVIVRPAGSKLNVLEPRSEGDAFLKAFDLFDRMICQTILGQARAAMESKNSSKADGEIAQDGRGILTQFAREEVGELWTREVHYESVKLNFGESDAEEFTPSLQVGTTEHQDKPSMWSAAASAGWKLGPSQFDECDVMLEAPERDQEADDAAAKEQMQHEADVAAASKPVPAPGQPAGPRSPSSGKEAARNKA